MFESLFCFVIVVNAVCLGIQADIMARELTEEVPPVYVFLDRMFCLIFATELLMRFVAYGRSFFAEVGCMWGVFDICIVGLQVCEEGLALLAVVGRATADTGAADISMVRTMRILRLIRVLRIVRIIRFTRELRTLVVSIMNSMRSLFWTLSLLVLGIYVVGIYFTQVVLDFRLHAQEDVPVLSEFFGCLPQSMLTLYQAMSGGIDWNDVSRLLIRDISPVQGVVIVLYVAFTVLALTNVVTGVFVEGALKSAEQEEEHIVLDGVRSMFWGGKSRSGVLTREQFEERLAVAGMSDYLRSINVDTAEVELLFSLIDEGDTGSIDYEEFVGGCMRIRGPARAIDSILLLHEVMQTRRDFEARMHWVQEQTFQIADTVGAPLVALQGMAGSISEDGAQLSEADEEERDGFGFSQRSEAEDSRDDGSIHLS